MRNIIIITFDLFVSRISSSLTKKGDTNILKGIKTKIIKSSKIKNIQNFNKIIFSGSDVVEVPVTSPKQSAVTTSREKSKSPPAVRHSKARSPSPIPENGAGDCLSIEETNKLRAKLGLKPLEVDSGPINSKKDGESSLAGKSTDKNGDPIDLNQYKDDYGEFYHKPAENLAEKKQHEKIRDKLKERKEKRKLEDKLNRIRTLGESDDEEENAVHWVEKNREKEKLRKEAERRAKLLEEMDKEFGVSDLVDQESRNAKREAYKSRDLQGLRVEHGQEEFTEGREIILTLKDKEVLAEDDDALINVNMIDDEKYKKNVENKKLNPNNYGYDAFEETMDEYGEIQGRSILKKYDEEIDGRKKSSFRIGNDDDEKSQKRKLLEIKAKLAGKALHNLDDTNLTLASEYYSQEELTAFKKPKKKVKKIRKKLKADDLLAMNAENESSGSKDLGSRKRLKHEANGILLTDDVPNIPMDVSDVKIEDDDEDLQYVLAKARRLKQKEALITKSIDLKPEIKSEPNSDDEMEGRDSNIILDATAEFCRTLGDIPTYGLSGNRDDDANDLMDFEQDVEDVHIPEEENESGVGVWCSVNPDAEREISNHPLEISDVAILDEEPDVSAGVAGALRLAMSKGYLEKDENNRPSGSRMAHLQAKNYSIEDKTYG